MIQILATQFNSGGPFMWVILATLGFGFAVVMERFLYFFVFCRGNSSMIVNKIGNALKKDQYDEAKKIIGKRKAPLFNLLRTAIEQYTAGAPIKTIQEKVEETAIKEVPKMSKRLNYLSLIANIATLLGLLGTIIGLQVSFSSLASVDVTRKAAMLAAGISQAMNTTAFGLIVAVPCMVFYTALHNKENTLIQDVDESVVRVINYMKEKRV
ncbi:MAG: MotA/TolQ/ExbB proton channel family protein [Chitinispirillia bacterium]|jgi:biopolymer transport protein ExbB/TolQ